MAVIGPTRCGKTANALSGVLEWNGPAILFSVKNDLLGATLDIRRKLGEVRVFDPTRATKVDERAGWSPLRAAATPTGAQKAARVLADAGPKDGAENPKFFGAMADQLLWPLLYTAAVADRSMVDVVRWVLSQDRPVDGMPGEVASLLDAELVGKDALRRSWAAAARWRGTHRRIRPVPWPRCCAGDGDRHRQAGGASRATSRTRVARRGPANEGTVEDEGLDEPLAG